MFKTRKTLICLIILLLTVTLLAGCGKKEKETADQISDQPAITESERDQFRSALDFAAAKSYEDLQGVPLYVGSSEIDNSRMLSGNVLTAAFNIMAKDSEFTTFYERELPNFGWNIVKREITADSIKIEATKSGRLATITAEVEDEKISEYKIITD